MRILIELLVADDTDITEEDKQWAIKGAKDGLMVRHVHDEGIRRGFGHRPTPTDTRELRDAFRMLVGGRIV